MRATHLAVVALLIILVAVSGYVVETRMGPHTSPVSPTTTGASSPASGSFKLYLDYTNGTQVQIFPNGPTMSVTCGSCSGGGSAITFSPSIAVSFTGDTITGGSCSGTVSFNSPGGVSVASQSVSGTGSASTSPMACPMTAATVPFSDFSSLASGTYTLTATLNGQGSVTFTFGGPDSGVGYPITAVSASVSITVSGGTVTGVSGSI
ncbi:MAG: hypothetical protein JRN54_03455 [Nitrososphaerota archaeon]|nr:hypothetical protein [Nitrososphaerota archaeon]